MIEKKRFTLILPVGSGFVLWLYPPSRELWIIPIIVFFSSFVIFWNIPYLTNFLHKKPLYYEDLQDNVNTELKDKFQIYFNASINVLLSFTACSLLDYIFYNLKTSELSWQERIAMLGGMISIYVRVQNHIGKVLLVLLINRKNNLQRLRTTSDTGNISVEI